MAAEADWVMLFGLPPVNSAVGNESSGAMSTTAGIGNLDDPEPAYPAVWIRPERGVRDTYASHIIDDEATVTHVHAIGHNWQRGIAEWEVEFWSSTPDTPAFYASAVPDTFQGAVTNLSGAIGVIQDDPDDPDGNWLTATSSSSDTAFRTRVSSLSPASLEPGDREQELRVLVRRTNTGTPGAHPTLGVELWQNGSFVSTLLSGYSVSSTSGEVVSVLFNGNLLSGITNIEFRFTGTAANGRTLEFGAAVLYAYTSNPDRLSRTGWQTIEADASPAAFGGTSPFVGVEEPRKIETMALSAPITGAVAAVTKFRDPTNPDGYLSIGCIVYSFGWQPSRLNMANGGGVGVIDQSKTERTQGGVLASQPVLPRREATFTLPVLTHAEAEQISLRCAWRCGVTRPYGVCLNPDSDFGRRFQTVWGRNAQGSVPKPTFRPGAADGESLYECSFRIEEA